MSKARIRSVVFAALLLGLSGFARGQCSRPIRVPVAPIGQAVMIVDGKVGGIYPELLQAEANKAHCTIDFQVVPRARQEMLFETGQADLLMPARRSARRDSYGAFVSMVRSRAMLLSMNSRKPPAASLAEILAHSELRVGVVRGYDYDAPYQSVVKQLLEQNRLTEASDPTSLARMLQAGIVDVAIVTPLAVTGALRDDPKLSPLIEQIRAEPASELMWGESGAYVTRSNSLDDADRERVTALLDHIGRTGAVWRAFQRYYPERDLSDSVRPR